MCIREFVMALRLCFPFRHPGRKRRNSDPYRPTQVQIDKELLEHLQTLKSQNEELVQANSQLQMKADQAIERTEKLTHDLAKVQDELREETKEKDALSRANERLKGELNDSKEKHKTKEESWSKKIKKLRKSKKEEQPIYEDKPKATEYELLTKNIKDMERKLDMKTEETAATKETNCRLRETIDELRRALSVAQSMDEEQNKRIEFLHHHVAELQQQLKQQKLTAKEDREKLRQTSSELGRASSLLETTQKQLEASQRSLASANSRADGLSRDLADAEDARDDVTYRLSSLERQCMQARERFLAQDERCLRLEKQVDGLQEEVEEKEMENRRLRRDIRLSKRQLEKLREQVLDSTFSPKHTSPRINSLNLETQYCYSPEVKVKEFLID